MTPTFKWLYLHLHAQYRLPDPLPPPILCPGRAVGEEAEMLLPGRCTAHVHIYIYELPEDIDLHSINTSCISASLETGATQKQYSVWWHSSPFAAKLNCMQNLYLITSTRLVPVIYLHILVQSWIRELISFHTEWKSTNMSTTVWIPHNQSLQACPVMQLFKVWKPV